MTHLNDEQFEAALGEASAQAEHLDRCPACCQRLGELRAIRGRLRSAFASLTAPAALVDRVRESAKPATVVRRRRYLWPMLAAAASILLAVPVVVYLARPSQAQAAQQELVNIHHRNLTETQCFYSEDEPEKLAEYLKDNLGFAPAMPKLNQGMAIRGCCLAHFREKIVGSYVVDTPHGVVSIIVVTDPPASIGLKRGEGPIWQGNLGMCNMAAVRMGDYTYTAVGEVSQESMTKLLGLLMR